MREDTGSLRAGMVFSPLCTPCSCLALKKCSKTVQWGTNEDQVETVIINWNEDSVVPEVVEMRFILVK